MIYFQCLSYIYLFYSLAESERERGRERERERGWMMPTNLKFFLCQGITINLKVSGMHLQSKLGYIYSGSKALSCHAVCLFQLKRVFVLSMGIKNILSVIIALFLWLLKVFCVIIARYFMAIESFLCVIIALFCGY